MTTPAPGNDPREDAATALDCTPLPSTPTFPVYGRGPDFTGARWVELWNPPPPSPLVEVHLGHGNAGEHPQHSPWVLVITVATALPDAERGHAQRPNPLQDAALSALLYLHHAEPGPLLRQQAVTHLVDLSYRRDVPPWSLANCTILGEPVTVLRYRRGPLWVAAADLGEVAVSLVGHGQHLEDLNLEPVNSTLEQYRTAQ